MFPASVHVVVDVQFQHEWFDLVRMLGVHEVLSVGGLRGGGVEGREIMGVLPFLICIRRQGDRCG